jgi:iron complex outermembrane receptor protein
MTCLGSLAVDHGSFALAQDQSGATVSEVIVTGTRQSGVKAADSAAPIEVVGATALKQTGYTDLADALATSVPSLNVQQNGGDAAALVVQAALRGLNPNDTLVLVDGKRRNTTADLGVDGGSAYSGAAAVDLSFIPVAAIDHVEVLTDGAAAQYGSDAIAGVVNVILKKSDHGGSVSATGGQYYEGDGDTGAWSLNKGFSLGDKGYANVTVEERYHDFSQQGYGDRRFTNADGSLASGLDATTTAGVQASTNFPNENKVNGDPDYNVYNIFYNVGYDLGDGVQAYAFGSYGNRNASHYENYRTPEKVEGVSSTGETIIPLPDGFDPREQIKEQEYSFTEGVKGKLYGWNWDLSTVYGEDNDQVYTINSANAQLFPVLQAVSSTPVNPQRNFYDGAYIGTELTNTLDLDRSFSVGLASPLNVAVGAEQRRDTYGIAAGEPSAYYGAGAQSFTGYTLTDQGVHARTNYAVYGDLAVDPISHLLVDLAGRYENYSDFGGATVGKLTSRYDFTPDFAVRGTVSTGFRAPTLAEEYYSGTNVSPNSADVQLPPNSPASSQAGFGSLKPEISHNYSVGFVYHPIPRLQITADAYDIIIHNRILVSGFLFGSSEGYTAPASYGLKPGVVSQGVLNAIAARGITLDSGLSYAGISLFANAANTRTDGVEVTATYSSDFDQFGHVDWSLGFNYNQNAVTKLFPLPAAVTNADFGQTSFLDKSALSALTNSTPQDKAVLQGYWTLGKWSVNLRETIYGPSSEWVSYDGSGTGAGAYDERIGVTGITDLDIGYKLTSSLKLEVGANNLFNTYPPLTPTVGGRPTDGGYVYSVPYSFAPWGNNGGYYYGRVTFTF